MREGTKRLFIGRFQVKRLNDAEEDCFIDEEQGITIWGGSEQGQSAMEVAKDFNGKEVEITIQEVFRLKSTLAKKKRAVCAWQL